MDIHDVWELSSERPEIIVLPAACFLKTVEHNMAS